MAHTLKPGDKIKDNDPRTRIRILTVTALDEHYVWAVHATRTVRIRRERVHMDGKERRSGFSLVD